MMINFDNLRLSYIRHFHTLKQASLRTSFPSLNPLGRTRLLKMERPANSSSSHTSRRSIVTSPSRPNFEFYTLSHSSSRWSRIGTRSCRTSGRRYYHSGHSGYSRSGGGGLSVDQAYWILFGLNSVSFATWWYARLTQNTSLLQTHLNNTLTSLAAWDRGHYWTVLTSAFTHHDLMHFAFNMLTLRTFCQIVGYVPGIGGGHVLLLALGSALAGSGGWLWQQKTKLSSLQTTSSGSWGSNRSSVAAAQTYNASALGASGVVMGVGALATCLLPKMPLQLMFIPVGIPLWVITIGYALVDAYYLDSASSRVAHSGHLGGLIAGTTYYALFLRKAPVGVWRSVSNMFGRR